MTIYLAPAGGGDPGFDGDDVGGHGSYLQGCGDAVNDVPCFHGPVQQEHIDQFPGSGGVAVDFPGLSPERFMGMNRPGFNGGS